jgi:hypothetical protein
VQTCVRERKEGGEKDAIERERQGRRGRAPLARHPHGDHDGAAPSGEQQEKGSVAVLRCGFVERDGVEWRGVGVVV